MRPGDMLNLPRNSVHAAQELLNHLVEGPISHISGDTQTFHTLQETANSKIMYIVCQICSTDGKQANGTVGSIKSSEG